jgi:hypothetical protein
LSRRLVFTIALVAALLTAEPAGAADRYVAPGGAASGGCNSANPCSVEYALGGSGSATGDRVIVAHGTYTITTPIVVDKELRVVGEAGEPRPVLRAGPAFTGSGHFIYVKVIAGMPASSVEHLTIESASNGQASATPLGGRVRGRDLDVTGGNACVHIAPPGGLEDSTLHMTGPGVCLGASGDVSLGHSKIENVTVDAPANVARPDSSHGAAVSLDGDVVAEGLDVTAAGPALAMTGHVWNTTPRVIVRRSRIESATAGVITSFRGLLLTDTVVFASGANATAIDTGSVVLRNVTATAPGTGGVALRAAPYLNDADGSGFVYAGNSIFRGDTVDVRIPQPPVFQPGPPPEYWAFTTVHAAHSNYRTVDRHPDAPAVIDDGGNISSDPMWVNPAMGDFHLRSDSESIDAGADYPENGAFDLDGHFRKLGDAVDMGAYEFCPAGVECSPPPPPATGPGETPGGGDQGGGDHDGAIVGKDPVATEHPLGPGSARDVIAPVLTSLKLSRARFTTARGTRFSWRQSERGRVTITILKKKDVVGTIARGGRRGGNSLAFHGKVGKKKLTPGIYTAVVRVTDAAGNRGRAATIAFRVLRR